jgi:hypothetical protein
MTSRSLRPGLQWLRDDDTVQVVISAEQPALRLRGADAQIWELWIGGCDPGTVVAEVALCRRLQPEEVRRRFRALLHRLVESSATVSAELK